MMLLRCFFPVSLDCLGLFDQLQAQAPVPLAEIGKRLKLHSLLHKFRGTGWDAMGQLIFGKRDDIFIAVFFRDNDGGITGFQAGKVGNKTGYAAVAVPKRMNAHKGEVQSCI